MKTILFSNGDSIEMTYEEVRKRFSPMVIKAMKRANNKFVYNKIDEEDFKQELDIELWRAYDQYDPESGNCFSTYLYYKLQKGVRNVTYSRYSLKNRHNGIFSMQAPIGEDDLKLEDMFAAEDDSMESLEVNDLTDIIRSNVSDEEEELLQILMDKKQFSVQDYATRHNITRQAANQRVIKLKKKLQNVVAKEYLEII